MSTPKKKVRSEVIRSFSESPLEVKLRGPEEGGLERGMKVQPYVCSDRILDDDSRATVKTQARLPERR